MTIAPPLLQPLDSRPLSWLEESEEEDILDADGIEYITSDGEPMAETLLHRNLMMYVIQALLFYFVDREDVHVSGNDFIHYQRGDGNKYVSPDCYVVFGVPGGERDNFKVWEEGGHFPDVIIEFTSRKTRKQDFGEKKTLYEQVFQTEEYYIFDPTGKRKKQRLQGWRLENGVYTEIAVKDGRLLSEKLGLELVTEGNRLRLFDPVKGEFMRTHAEAEEERLLALQQAEEEKQQATRERRRANAEARRAEQETLRADSAEAELSRLRAELEALRKAQKGTDTP